MNSNYPTVTIGCPVRDRANYLPTYLKCVYDLDYPKENITLLFVENDSTDNTYDILYQYKFENSNLYNRIKIEKYNQFTPKDIRTSNIREKYTYHSLSKLRNYWLAQVKTDYALSCDSDIMMKPDTLTKLINHKKDYVAGLIINGYLFDKEQPDNYLNILKKNKNNYVHIKNYSPNELIEVDFTGAVMLLSKKATKLGKFDWHLQGEDACFCESLKESGIKIYCDTSAKCTHCMSEEYLELYKQGKFIFE
jgi:glycosyltransferase involved in cell wall biosynthesis